MPNVFVYEGDCLEVMRGMPDESIDAVVCDPPYGLGKPPPVADVLRAWLAGEPYHAKGGGFMGAKWDAFVPGPEVWRECLRVLKPGGHLLAFFGTRTYHLGATAVELAGFEVRDLIAWLYGQGFPKSRNVSKDIDKAAGATRKVLGKSARHVSGKPSQRTAGLCGTSTFAESVGMGAYITAPATPEAPEAAQWEGWGTALKPALEPVVFARKPFKGATYRQVLATGTGAINVDGCRIGDEEISQHGRSGDSFGFTSAEPAGRTWTGRWPANVALDEEAAAMLDAQSGTRKSGGGRRRPKAWSTGVYAMRGAADDYSRAASEGGASRFFYCSKASDRERSAGVGDLKTRHKTVKPLGLMRWLVRLVTPPGGTVLDPFAGSGTTGLAAQAEGFGAVLIEREPEYFALAQTKNAHLALLRGITALGDT